MNKKTLVVILGIVTLVALTAALQEKEIPENITLKGEKKEAVAFPHKLHHDAGYTCQTCHHNMAEDAELPEQTCSECHVKDHKVKPMKAFHDTCLKCHRAVNKEKGTKLSTKCAECHKKK